jgi:hypothetical protein
MRGVLLEMLYCGLDGLHGDRGQELVSVLSDVVNLLLDKIWIFCVESVKKDRIADFLGAV